MPLETHLGLLDGLAALSERYWGWRDDLGLTTMEERFRFFAPDNIAAEVAVDDPPVPIAVAAQGWPRLSEIAPALGELLHAIHVEPTPLADALRSTPIDVSPGRLEDGQPRDASRRAHDPARLGVPGCRARVLGPRLVPGAQLPAPADEQGRHDRRVPGCARAARHRDRELVRPPGSTSACSASPRASVGRRR